MHKVIFLFVVAALLTSCNNEQAASDNVDAAAGDTTTASANEDGWQSLFDGTTTKGWHSYGKDSVGSAWKVQDGALYLDTSQKEGWQVKGGGDLLTDEEFENYHLKLEWKISPNGNSGIIFNVNEDTSKYEYSWYTGLEMQVQDDKGHPDGKIPKHRAGDLYDLIASSSPAVKPPGEWNLAEVVHDKGKLDLFLNGVNIVSTTIGDANWKELVNKSKFKERKDFATFSKGRIALQDHGNAVYYRNIVIKKL